MCSWLLLHLLGFVYFFFSSLAYIASSLRLSSLLSFPSALPRFLLFDVIPISFFSLFSASLSFAAVALSGRFRFRSRDLPVSPSFYLPNYLSFLAALPVLLSPWL